MVELTGLSWNNLQLSSAKWTHICARASAIVNELSSEHSCAGVTDCKFPTTTMMSSILKVVTIVTSYPIGRDAIHETVGIALICWTKSVRKVRNEE